MRLIDADELKYKNLAEVNGKLTYVLTAEEIDNAPTVEDRPQGEWIDYNNTFYKCPDCGYLLEKCCPQCQNKVILPKDGADMRGKEE